MDYVSWCVLVLWVILLSFCLEVGIKESLLLLLRHALLLQPCPVTVLNQRNCYTWNMFGKEYYYAAYCILECMYNLIIIIIIHYIYIALFKALKALYIEGGNLLNHHQCAASTWMMRQQPYCARTPTSHQLTGGEETVMKPISVWGWLGGHDGQRPMGKFGQDAGVTPLLFSKDILGFLMTTESQDPRFNVSSEGRCLLTV